MGYEDVGPRGGEAFAVLLLATWLLVETTTTVMARIFLMALVVVVVDVCGMVIAELSLQAVALQIYEGLHPSQLETAVELFADIADLVCHVQPRRQRLTECHIDLRMAFDVEDTPPISGQPAGSRQLSSGRHQ